MQKGNLDFSDLKSIILDEADEMLNMGFKDDVDEILTQVYDQNKSSP